MPHFKNGLTRVGKVYHYCFRINGQQYKGSTRATDRASAEKILEQKRKEALLGPQDISAPIPTLQSLVSSWITSYGATYSQRHLELVTSCAKVWLVPHLGDHYLNRISTQSVLDLRRRMLEAGRSPATANLMLRNLKLLMAYAIRLDHLKEMPFKVSPLKLQRKPRPTIPAERVGEFFSIIDNLTTKPQVRAMFRMMVGLGLRTGEVLNARWEWVDPIRRTYTVGRAKGKENRVLPIPDWLWVHLTLPSKMLSGWIFPCEKGRPHGRMYLMRYIRQAAIIIGIPGLTQHRLRASFATLHAEAGTPVPEIQGMLGHKNIATTMIYVETSLEAKRRAQDTLSQKLGLA